MKTHKQRLYLDTSVIGGYFDKEFEEATHILFEKIKLDQFEIVYSEVTEGELFDAPPQVQSLMKTLPQDTITTVQLTEESLELAERYIKEKVVGKTSRTDCYHIALATIHKVDILVSWNFKHIVNVQRIRGYNSVNLKWGYPPIDIRSPKEIIYSENES